MEEAAGVWAVSGSLAWHPAIPGWDGRKCGDGEDYGGSGRKCSPI